MIFNPVLIIGLIIILFGIGGLINERITRWINLPGNPQIKAIGSIVIGVILFIIGLL